VSSRYGSKKSAFGSDEATEPDIAEINQFRVLDVPEIGGIGEHTIERGLGNIEFRCVHTVERDLSSLRERCVSTGHFNLFPGDGNRFFVASPVADFEGGETIGLCLRYFSMMFLHPPLPMQDSFAWRKSQDV
jgi:hypothetical protein